MKQTAFTLAEVLITLGIIGVVAAMTLPSLIANHQKQVYVTGAKKAVNTVSNMFYKIMADEEVASVKDTSIFAKSYCVSNLELDSDGKPINLGSYGSECDDGYGDSSALESVIPKYIKTVKICKGLQCGTGIRHRQNDFTCNNDVCTLISGSTTFGTFDSGYADSLDKLVVYSSDGIIYYFAPGSYGLMVAFDVNGERGPNEHGRDLFYMMSRDGKIYGSSWTSGQFGEKTPLGHLMSNGWNMDY